MITYNEDSATVQAENYDAWNEPADLRAQRLHVERLIGELKQLSNYMEAKADAIECRKEGNIQFAKRYELTCDACYDSLATWLRW